MHLRVIPYANNSIISLSSTCAAAAIALGTQINLKQNDTPAVCADHYDLMGEPGTDPATAGKQGALNVARQAALEAEEARRTAVTAGRLFNERALDHLHGFLGRRWNPRWTALGFTGGSIALPRDPKPLLLQFRAYFMANPQHEFPQNEVTAAQADAAAVAIDQAILAEAEARTARAKAQEARDEAMQRVRDRLVGLRSELDQLLDADDMRWRTFGFARPIDRRIPRKVAEVTLRPAGEAGEVIVQWEAARGADSYRVSYQVQGVDEAPREVGIFVDRTAIISNLPAGKTVIVSITARNPAGETAATNGAIVTSVATRTEGLADAQPVDRPKVAETFHSEVEDYEVFEIALEPHLATRLVSAASMRRRGAMPEHVD